MKINIRVDENLKRKGLVFSPRTMPAGKRILDIWIKSFADKKCKTCKGGGFMLLPAYQTCKDCWRDNESR